MGSHAIRPLKACSQGHLRSGCALKAAAFRPKSNDGSKPREIKAVPFLDVPFLPPWEIERRNREERQKRDNERPQPSVDIDVPFPSYPPLSEPPPRSEREPRICDVL